MRLMKIVVGVMALFAVRANAQCGWEAIGAGLNNSGDALVVMPNQDIIAGGCFTSAGGVPVNRIARWNGDVWSSLGSGVNDYVRVLLGLKNGDLLVGGDINVAGDVAARRVARWDGSNWSSLGGGLGCDSGTYGGSVVALAVLPNADVIASGNFACFATGVTGIARWDGSVWYPIVPRPEGMVSEFAVRPNGELIVGGNFSEIGQMSVNNIARLNGNTWSAMGLGCNGRVTSLAICGNGNVFAAGYFTAADGHPANRIARWDGSGWYALGSGLSDNVEDLAILSNGDLVVGGFFTHAGGVVVNGIARWDGHAWYPIGAGMNGYVSSLAVTQAGDLVAGGFFTTAGEATANNIAIFRSLRIDSQPQSQIGCVGKSVLLSVDVTGATPRFQWRKNGLNIPGAVSSDFSISSASVSDSGAYDCVVSNACGSVTSAAASVTVLTPQILNSPFDQSVNVDQPVNFVVETDESSPCHSNLQFQWQRRDPLVADDNEPNAWITLQNGGGIFGATSPNLLILRPTPGLATGYRCRITGGCGCEFANSSVYYTRTVNYSAACPSDFNLDGSVDGDDVITFFERWDSGC